jgi:acyl-CoA synthetase (AMP-forming)/AMP-acid ligase II
LTRYCKERLASYKVPKEFIAVAQLPKSSTGKILRRKIREAEGDSGPQRV